jgi:hypothetical protein
MELTPISKLEPFRERAMPWRVAARLTFARSIDHENHL